MIGQGEIGWTLADIAAQLGGDVLGDGQTVITQVATVILLSWPIANIEAS